MGFLGDFRYHSPLMDLGAGMTGLFLLDVIDVARALGFEPRQATAEQVADWLLSKYSKKPRGGFNYHPAMNCLFDLFSGRSNEKSAVQYCLTTGNPKGRRQNADAVKCVAAYALEHESRCYPVAFTALAVGRVKQQTVYVSMKAPLVRVEHGVASVVMPGFRMSYRPMEPEIDVACSIALANLARDDYEGAGFEYLYAGPGMNGQREFRAIDGRSRKIYDRDEVDSLVDIYVKGVALALERGAVAKKPDLRTYRIIDPDQPHLF